ncbi:MAG: histidine kinase [Thermoanaerobaculia bacterium]|nr:histidine kinase [Thermoanaerobaculia bacterium]
MTTNRWIAIWRIAVAGCLILFVSSQGPRSGLILALVYATFAITTLLVAPRITERVSARSIVLVADVVLLAGAILLGMVPVFLPLIHLVASAALLLGSFAAIVTAAALLPILTLSIASFLPTTPVLMVSLIVSALILSTAAFDRERAVRGRLEERLLRDERIRIARELHDGPLQSVIGARLGLELSEQDESAGRYGESLEAIRRQIQSLIRELRPVAVSPEESRFTTRLHLLAIEVKREWGVDLEIDDIPFTREMAKGYRREVRQLIRESVINAARHSRGKTITVSGRVEDHSLRLTVRDDGKGFPFKGEFDLRDLQEIPSAPETLRERIERVGGELTILSTEQGSTLSMRIPLQEPA